eukprot:706771-Rhodomonas_salina.1
MGARIHITRPGADQCAGGVRTRSVNPAEKTAAVAATGVGAVARMRARVGPVPAVPRAPTVLRAAA